MKALTLLLLLPCVLLLSGCVTLTGELPFNADGRPGAFAGKLGVNYSWPPPGSPSGKEPVGKEPVPGLPLGASRAPTQAEWDYFQTLFGQKAPATP